jgi:hypothetical protein
MLNYQQPVGKGAASAVPFFFIEMKTAHIDVSERMDSHLFFCYSPHHIFRCPSAPPLPGYRKALPR